MIGNSPCCCFPWNCCYWWWASCWYFFTPIGVLFILIYSWVDYSEATYGKYEYPQWAAALGWLMTISVVLGIFITGIVMIIIKVVRGVSRLSILCCVIVGAEVGNARYMMSSCFGLYTGACQGTVPTIPLLGTCS